MEDARSVATERPARSLIGQPPRHAFTFPFLAHHPMKHIVLAVDSRRGMFDRNTVFGDISNAKYGLYRLTPKVSLIRAAAASTSFGTSTCAIKFLPLGP